LIYPKINAFKIKSIIDNYLIMLRAGIDKKGINNHYHNSTFGRNKKNI
jgi:hypothetical protein